MVLRQTGVVRPESLQAITLGIAYERQSGLVLDRLARAVAEQEGAALARVWLVSDGDVCGSCVMAPECPDRTRCLHLVASAGSPLDGSATWSRLDGDFRRFPLGVRKVGKVGATGSGILLHDMSERSAWIARPDWARREGIRSFAAQPLVARGEVLGVLGVFSRSRIDAAAFAWLRAVADHAAAAIANARAFEALDRLRVRLEAENGCLREDARRALGTDVVGASPALARALAQADLAAATDAAVLVVGEPGTGKELVARRIHERSRRAAGPFITLDRAAVERELVGRVEAADGGTLFLDEVGDVPLGLQPALLRVLAAGELERPHDPRPRRVDIRVVAATARDLRAETAAGRFREDFFLRLSVLAIDVPPLRERPGDVAALAEHFVHRASARLGRPPVRLASRDLRALERHPWPGNVRELASVIERAVVSARDGRAHLDVVAPPTAAGDDVVSAADLRRRERANVEAALRRADGRIYGPGGAAELLGVPPTTLSSRVKALGIARPRGA